MRGFFAFLQIMTPEAGRLGVLGSGSFSAVGGGWEGAEAKAEADRKREVDTRGQTHNDL